MTEEEKTELAELIAAASNGESKNKNPLLSWWPVLCTAVIVVGQTFVVMHKFETHDKLDGHSEVTQDLAGLVRRVDLLEANLIPVFSHISDKQIHQTESEKTALVMGTLEPIKLQNQRLEINQESHKSQLAEIKTVLTEIRQELCDRKGGD